MNEHQKKAYGSVMDIGEAISKLIVHAKSSMQPLELPEAVVLKLIEAQQAVFAANRLMQEMV
jgi:hypothetical protein